MLVILIIHSNTSVLLKASSACMSEINIKNIYIHTINSDTYRKGYLHTCSSILWCFFCWIVDVTGNHWKERIEQNLMAIYDTLPFSQHPPFYDDIES